MTTPDTKFKLCDKRNAILDSAGHMLVQGGPGCGKTTIALLKAKRAVLDKLKPWQSVLFLSFSNAAIRRINESAGTLLNAEIGKQVDIRTYHSFAWEILRSHGYLLSSQRILHLVAPQDAEVLRADVEDEAWNNEQIRLFEMEGRLTFDQFAERAAELLERASAVRNLYCETYPLILVDEFQDTDEDQWRLVRVLSTGSDIVALGDTEQRIYEWRRGVSDTRLEEFANHLDAVTYDFQNENYRSPTTGIAGFARSLLSPNTRNTLPDDISFNKFITGQFDIFLRFALYSSIQETLKRAKRSDIKIAIAARTGFVVRMISDSLSKQLTFKGNIHEAYSHDVMIDVHQVTLAARVVAYLLASQNCNRKERLAGTLERLSDVFRSLRTPTGIKDSNQLRRWAADIRSDKTLNYNCVKALSIILNSIDEHGLIGAPRKDWSAIQKLIQAADAVQLQRTGKLAKYLRLLRRGSAIEDRLAQLWADNCSYAGAVSALDEAILQDKLADSNRESSGVCVMTMHQLKGREYDGVLLVETQHKTFIAQDTSPQFIDTRRLLQVSLTRARHFAYILSEQKNATLDKFLQN